MDEEHVWTHLLLLDFAQHGRQWSGSCLGHSSPWKEPRFPLYSRIGGPDNTSILRAVEEIHVLYLRICLSSSSSATTLTGPCFISLILELLSHFNIAHPTYFAYLKSNVIRLPICGLNIKGLMVIPLRIKYWPLKVKYLLFKYECINKRADRIKRDIHGSVHHNIIYENDQQVATV
jgi:hypothetical protein